MEDKDLQRFINLHSVKRELNVGLILELRTFYINQAKESMKLLQSSLVPHDSCRWEGTRRLAEQALNSARVLGEILMISGMMSTTEYLPYLNEGQTLYEELTYTV